MQKFKSVDPSLYFLVVFAFLTAAAVVAINIVTYTGKGGPLNNSLENVTAKYTTDLTPQPIGFIVVWSIAFAWNTTYTMYLLVSLCLSADNSPVRTTPTLTPKMFLIFYMFGCVFLVSWQFAYQSELMTTAFVLLALSCVCLWAATRESLLATYHRQCTCGKINKAMIWLVRVLLQNGLAYFATLLTADIFAGLAIALIYKDSYGKPQAEIRGGYSIEEGSAAALTGFIVLISAFAIFENVMYREFFQYIFSVMPGLVAVFANIVSKLDEEGNHNRNFQIASTALGVCIGLAVTRIVISILSLTGKFFNINFSFLWPKNSFSEIKFLIKNNRNIESKNLKIDFKYSTPVRKVIGTGN